MRCREGKDRAAVVDPALFSENPNHAFVAGDLDVLPHDAEDVPEEGVEPVQRREGEGEPAGPDVAALPMDEFVDQDLPQGLLGQTGGTGRQDEDRTEDSGDIGSAGRSELHDADGDSTDPDPLSGFLQHRQEAVVDEIRCVAQPGAGPHVYEDEPEKYGGSSDGPDPDGEGAQGQRRERSDGRGRGDRQDGRLRDGEDYLVRKDLFAEPKETLLDRSDQVVHADWGGGEDRHHETKQEESPEKHVDAGIETVAERRLEQEDRKGGKGAGQGIAQEFSGRRHGAPPPSHRGSFEAHRFRRR